MVDDFNMASCWVDGSSWSIDSGGRNMVEGNQVQLQAGESIAQTGTKLAEKPGLVVSLKVVSEGRNKVEENSVWLQAGRQKLPQVGESAVQTGKKLAEKLDIAVGWKVIGEGRNVVKGNRVQLRGGVIICCSRDCIGDRD